MERGAIVPQRGGLFNTVFSGQLVLQQGVNGYNGCLDAHMVMTSASSNYESANLLELDYFTGG